MKEDKEVATMSKHVKFQPKVRHTLNGKQMSISEAIQLVVEEFLSTPLDERLEKLSGRLKNTDAELAKSITNIKAEYERSYWGTATGKGGEWKLVIVHGRGKPSVDAVKNKDGSVSIPSIMFYVDAHIERNLVSAVRALLAQTMIEALVGANQTPERYQEHM
ncbi:MAG: hypothetical protein LC785_14635, partial [Acidobacteria bacterium]|nr:hypothetical protein [Acidobacteriota bacterium]